MTGRCDDCPFSSGGLAPGGGETGGWVVVGEAPGRLEEAQQQPFVGLSGQLLRSALGALKSPPPLWLTNAMMCRPPGNATPSDAQLKACNPRLREELARVRPIKMLLCGNSAIQAVLPGADGVTKLRGRALWVPELDALAVATWHPAAVLRNPGLMRDFTADIEKLDRITEEQLHDVDVTYKLVRTDDDLRQMERDVDQRRLASLDIETRSSRYPGDPDFVISIGVGVMGSYWIVDETGFQLARGALQRLFDRTDVKWVAQNGYQFDVPSLVASLGLSARIDFDTMLAHYTIDERQPGAEVTMGIHGLKTLGQSYFDWPDYSEALNPYLAPVPIRLTVRYKSGETEVVELDDSEDLILGTTIRNKRIVEEYKARSDVQSCRVTATREATYGDIPRDVLFKYQALDLLCTLKLVPILRAQMEDEEVDHIHDQILLPAAKALGQIESYGVLVDRQYLLDLAARYGRELVDDLAELQAQTWPEFNPNSPIQVKKYCNEVLRLNVSDTAKETLEQYSHPWIRQLLEYRQKTKFLSTYVNGLLEASEHDGRVHTSFILIGTETGRLSSRRPNLQNIPQVAGPVIREAFIADEGWTMIEADFSQLELRVLAWYSGDERLTYVYQHGIDVHKQVASDVYEVPLEMVTKEQRYEAKYVDFGIAYGRGAESVAEALGWTVQRAQKFINKLMDEWAGARDWMVETQRQTRRDGFKRSAFGRLRRFPLITKDNRGEVERASVNTPIQSMASDICLIALTKLNNEVFDPDKARILLTVHDSILMQCRKGLEQQTLRTLLEVMEHPPVEDRGIPWEIGVKIGQRWGSLKEYDERDELLAAAGFDSREAYASHCASLRSPVWTR